MSDEPGRVSTFDRAVKFVCEMWNHDGPGSEMHVGDLAWGTFHCWPSALAALRLWTDRSGRIQALTMFDGTGVCDLVVRPGDAGQEAAALALNWAEAERTSAAIGPEPVELRVGRRLQSQGLVELLDVRGFARLRSGAPAMSRTITATDVDRPSIPDGYEIREIRTEDLASRVHAFDAAFPGEALSVDAYRGCEVARPTFRASTSSRCPRRTRSQHLQRSGWTRTTRSCRSNRLVVNPTTVAVA
jgi:hypothetical protein